LRYLITVVFISVSLLVSLTGCEADSKADLSYDDSFNPISIDLLEIQRRGKLVALCRYNATGYFIYKGRPMGYEYELLKKLANDLKVELEIIVPRSWDELYANLQEGKGDIIAANLIVTKEDSKIFDFTAPHSNTRQMLVQRKPQSWRDIPTHKLDKILVRNPIDLIGKSIHVRNNSPYSFRLNNLANEIGGDINVVGVPSGMESEFLIKMVSEGLINYTIANENMVGSFASYYSNIDAKTAISFPQQVAWGVRKDSPRLKSYIDNWIHKLRRTKNPYYNVVYNKYFKNRRAFLTRMNSEYFSHNSGKISPYDSLFMQYSKPLGWDWKLVASAAYQESRFNPNAESWAGAAGVMQLLPSTARELGVKDLFNPRESIRGGTKFMRLLYTYWKSIPEEVDRVAFTLASYNAGQGHVQDARRLAKKYGKNPDVWKDNVDEYLLKKSEERYFYDEVVRHGFCRGEEPYNYVKEIIARYEIYKHYGEYLGLNAKQIDMKGEPFSSLKR